MTLSTLKKTSRYAEIEHKRQNKKACDLYIAHSKRVVLIAFKYEADFPTLQACLLYNLIEDTKVTSEDIRKSFGKEIAFLVEGVTKADTLEDTMKKVEVYSSKDRRVIQIKLADRLDNTADLIRNKSLESLQKTITNYQNSNPFYIKLGKALGYKEMADALEELTNKLQPANSLSS